MCLSGETTVEVNWELPLSEQGHTLLVKRLLNDFKSSTAIVPLGKRGRYRKSISEVFQARQAIAFYDQVKPFFTRCLYHDDFDDVDGGDVG